MERDLTCQASSGHPTYKSRSTLDSSAATSTAIVPAIPHFLGSDLPHFPISFQTGWHCLSVSLTISARLSHVEDRLGTESQPLPTTVSTAPRLAGKMDPWTCCRARAEAVLKETCRGRRAAGLLLPIRRRVSCWEEGGRGRGKKEEGEMAGRRGRKRRERTRRCPFPSQMGTQRRAPGKHALQH